MEDLSKLIRTILKAAAKARAHKQRCNKFAHRLSLILTTMEPLKASKLEKFPELLELMKSLKEVLQRGHRLILECDNHSQLYLFFTAASYERRFTQLEKEMDSFLAVVPLVALSIASRMVGTMDDAAALPSRPHVALADGGSGDGSGLSVPDPAHSSICYGSDSSTGQHDQCVQEPMYPPGDTPDFSD